jgi:hypothetical protein
MEISKGEFVGGKLALVVLYQQANAKLVASKKAKARRTTATHPQGGGFLLIRQTIIWSAIAKAP